MDSIFEAVKRNVNIYDVVTRFGINLDRADKALCPFHKEDTPSFSIKRSDNIFHCFGCGAKGDVIEFVVRRNEITPIEAAKLLAEIFGIECGHVKGNKSIGVSAASGGKSRRGANAGLRTGIKEYIARCEAAVDDTDFFIKRGLTAETIKHFHLGYDSEKHCAVMPYSSNLDYYQTRTIVGREFRKPSTEEAGPEPLYNPAALKSTGSVFVVESPICAMSIVQSGGQAVAICSATGGQKLINEVKGTALKCNFVLCLDNDPPGQKAQQELANSLFEVGAKFIVYNVSGELKDPNELLMADPKALRANVREAVGTAKREFSKLKKMFSAAELQRREMRSIRWIVHDLLPEGLSLLAAPSKYGKSWMMMQLCLAVTQGATFLDRKTEKCDCVYISLEDSERRFKSRLNLMTGDKRAPDGFYGMVSALSMANGLFEQLGEMMETYPGIGLIIIDTFQKVRGGQHKNESVYGADYREMGEMKAFADKYGICLLLVHHLRKQDDDSDVFNRINGSMAIMGASDTTWALSRKKRVDENTTLAVTGRDVKDAEMVLAFDKSTVNWIVLGNAADEASRRAEGEDEDNPVVKTIKTLVEKHPGGWRGNCSEIKLQIYEQTGALFQGSADTVGRTISKYLDRLSADNITHTEERGKRHLFRKRQPTLFSYGKDDDLFVLNTQEVQRGQEVQVGQRVTRGTRKKTVRQ